MIDALTALRLQLEWGADEALGDTAIDRFAPPRPAGPRAVQTRPPARPAPQASTLEALYAEIDAFEASPLRATATHTVRPDGNPAAALVVVGEAPGSDDDRSGRAFSGAPGQLLDRVLGSIGLDRQTMLLTTLVPWRPPGNRPLSETEIQLCLPFLHRLLALVRPERLLLLGAAPVRTLTGQSEPLRRLRGRWLDVQIPEAQNSIAALCVPPLDQWLRSATTKCDLWSDLIKLRSTVTKG